MRTAQQVGIPGVFLCSRGKRVTRIALCSCGAPAPLLCDYPIGKLREADGNWLELTCDRPTCEACATNVGKDLDYCATHAQGQRAQQGTLFGGKP